MEQQLVAGIIQQNNQKVSFVAEEFRFSFLRTDVDKDELITITPDKAGYIWGRLYDGHVIAIYVKNRFEFETIKRIITWNYIVFNQNFEINGQGHGVFCGFDRICFTNGSVKSINADWALRHDIKKSQELNENPSDCDVDKKGMYFVYKALPNAMEYRVNLDGNSVTWSFGTVIRNTFSLDEGNKLEDTTSVMQLEFDDTQDLQTFYDYYGYVKTFIAFLTFRNDVLFEKIELLMKGGQRSSSSIAECYVRNDDAIVLGNTISSKENSVGNWEDRIKSSMRSITIKKLSEKMFQNILHCIIRPGKKYLGLPIGIIPQNSDDANRFSTDKISRICSALENEMDAAGIRLQKGDDLKAMIAEIKEIVNEYKNEGRLPKKTYDKIKGSMSHWGDSMADRAIVVWNENSEIMQGIRSLGMIDTITEEKIEKFVKTRNNIAHRGFLGLDEEIAETAYVLMCLVYVMALKRIGMDEEVIEELLRYGVVG